MIRYLVLILVFAIGINSICYSQKNNEEYSYSISLRTNLFSVLEVDGGIMLGLRYQWSKRFAAVLDPTFIFFNLYDNTNSTSNGQPIGIKIRSDLRYYLDKNTSRRNRYFIAPEFHYKYVSTKRWANFGINCIGQQCDYYMNAKYQQIKNETGGTLKLGAEIPLSDKDKWAIEVYGGLGFKFKNFKQKDIPAGGIFLASPASDDVFGFEEGTAIPVFPASIKISYRIR